MKTKPEGATMARPKVQFFNMIGKLYQGNSVKIEKQDIPLLRAGRFDVIDDYTMFWKVEVFGIGTYLVAAGHPDAKRQYVVWYPNGDFWYSFGKNISDAVERATVSRLSGDYNPSW